MRLDSVRLADINRAVGTRFKAARFLNAAELFDSGTSDANGIALSSIDNMLNTRQRRNINTTRRFQSPDYMPDYYRFRAHPFHPSGKT